MSWRDQGSYSDHAYFEKRGRALPTLAIIVALIACSSCAWLTPVRPAGIVRTTSTQTETSSTWPEDLWIIAKREPRARTSTAVTSQPQASLFPYLQKRSGDGQAPVPLPPQHTGVHAAVAGDVAAVSVQQQYLNPFAEKIDVEYVFALPEDAAVSEFVMTIGARHIRGIVRERREAERLYAEAKQAGHVAALLTQEQPNLFTPGVFAQAVANIEPGKEIDIDITYFHTLAYRDGEWELVFPMKVGSSSPAQQPSGGDVGIAVDIDAGMRIEAVHSPSHTVDVRRPSDGRAHVELSRSARLSDKDFVLRFRTAGDGVKSGWVGHHDERGGFFMLMLQPPADQRQALTEVEVDWGTLPVSDVYPAPIPDIQFGRPVVLHGRYSGVEPTTITVSGGAGSRRKSYRVTVSAADLGADHPALASMWARAHIEALERENSAPEPQSIPQRITQITDTALEYGLMSAYTTFLVVDAKGGAALPPAEP